MAPPSRQIVFLFSCAAVALGIEHEEADCSADGVCTAHPDKADDIDDMKVSLLQARKRKGASTLAASSGGTAVTGDSINKTGSVSGEPACCQWHDYKCMTSFCSPRSGNCYEKKDNIKDYYEFCPVSGQFDNPGAYPSCCGHSAWFSPKSDNCYSWKKKPYYMDCDGYKQMTGSGDVADCCQGCSGYCSPKSGNCYNFYDGKKKNVKYYYEFCSQGTALANGKNAPPCCRYNDWFSPFSMNCYGSKTKSYYLTCETFKYDMAHAMDR